MCFQAENKNIGLFLAIDMLKPCIYTNVVIDKRRLLQVFLNFLSNAMKFTPNGGYIKVHLRVMEEQRVLKDDQKDVSPEIKNKSSSELVKKVESRKCLWQGNLSNNSHQEPRGRSPKIIKETQKYVKI